MTSYWKKRSISKLKWAIFCTLCCWKTRSRNLYFCCDVWQIFFPDVQWGPKKVFPPPETRSVNGTTFLVHTVISQLFKQFIYKLDLVTRTDTKIAFFWEWVVLTYSNQSPINRELRKESFDTSKHILYGLFIIMISLRILRQTVQSSSADLLCNNSRKSRAHHDAFSNIQWFM